MLALPCCLPSSHSLSPSPGKAGAGLKSIMEESGAKIRVGHEEELPPGSNERCVGL
jgi:hypothetical protein